MIDLNTPIYDKIRVWISNARENEKKEWEDIRHPESFVKEKLEDFLKNQTRMNFWPSITPEQWIELVNQEETAERESIEISKNNGYAMIQMDGEENDARISSDPYSSWQLYRKRLISNGFKEQTVEEIKNASFKILKKLSSDTTHMKPIRGMVVGNVQSGKTANMAALMAMAADNGYNMFIVLSGTIENLRKQTQERLWNDLNHDGNIKWKGLNHLSRRSLWGERATDCNFTSNSERFFTVCLKNASRLKDLIQWLQVDPKKQAQMKILVIDDEADQAGINTADVNSGERKTINKLITNLVNGKDYKSKTISAKYKAMNYIGYTATPYANILNECKEDSLYPFNFITTLAVSKEYFGPQQIFGVDETDDNGEEYMGLDIVNIINESDLELIKGIHNDEVFTLPSTLKDAICWFMCGVACLRYIDYKKPISMLIHTSQKTEHHNNIAKLVMDWIKESSKEDLIEYCKKIWKIQTERMPLEKFLRQYPDYDRRYELKDYPEFNNILPYLEDLLKHEITNIKLDEDNELVYHNGLHLCVDNCKNNGISDEGMYVRLAYPDKDKMPEVAPAFIVIGGATLSRGLTIEGLISTYFLRSVGQADTLMQMGRWFGYRKGYELIPRIWITYKANEQFKFLSKLDYELRNEISEMSKLGKTPAEYAPRVRNTPKVSFIRITAKNKMQSVIKAELDYSGMYYQTYKFDKDEKILRNNINIVESFIRKLGNCEAHKEENKHAKNALVWKNVKFDVIKQMLLDYKFDSRLVVLNNIDVLISWVENETKKNNLDNWNVIVAGKNNDTNGVWKISNTDFKVNKVKRTRIKENNELDSQVNIGVLRDPKDIIADVDLTNAKQDLKDMVDSFKADKAKEIRNQAGLEATPQVIIYMIDKDSKYVKPTNNTSNSESKKERDDLGVNEDIVGLCINIPGVKKGKDGVARISIKLENINNYKGDLEDTDED